MNERIRQLAEQAEYYAEYTTPQGLEWLPTFKEKFAELIVRECALTAGLMEHEGRRGIGAQILENFGVKA